MIGKGVRFNAEKKQVGNYYSTKVRFYLHLKHPFLLIFNIAMFKIDCRKNKCLMQFF